MFYSKVSWTNKIVKSELMKYISHFGIGKRDWGRVLKTDKIKNFNISR